MTQGDLRQLVVAVITDHIYVMNSEQSGWCDWPIDIRSEVDLHNCCCM